MQVACDAWGAPASNAISLDLLRGLLFSFFSRVLVSGVVSTIFISTSFLDRKRTSWFYFKYKFILARILTQYWKNVIKILIKPTKGPNKNGIDCDNQIFCSVSQNVILVLDSFVDLVRTFFSVKRWWHLKIVITWKSITIWQEIISVYLCYRLRYSNRLPNTYTN